jgi:hypothetical protein
MGTLYKKNSVVLGVMYIYYFGCGMNSVDFAVDYSGCVVNNVPAVN